MTEDLVRNINVVANIISTVVIVVLTMAIINMNRRLAKIIEDNLKMRKSRGRDDV